MLCSFSCHTVDTIYLELDESNVTITKFFIIFLQTFEVINSYWFSSEPILKLKKVNTVEQVESRRKKERLKGSPRVKETRRSK